MKKAIVFIEVIEKQDDSGTITISTGSVDRDRDRVIPSGADVSNYLKNPVVQWGHNYRDPWATIGKTTSLEIGQDGIKASFDFREPVNEADPMNVIKALWGSNMIRSASIGFNPTEWEENDQGGLDFTSWELLEWSLVPIPANQEALRASVKGLSDGETITYHIIDKLDEPESVEPEPEEEIDTDLIDPEFVEPDPVPDPLPEIDPLLLEQIQTFLQQISQQLGE